MDWSLAIMPYGEEWRKVRRGFHQYFNSNVAPNYHTVHEEQSHDFLKRLRQTPEDFLDHIRQYVLCLSGQFQSPCLDMNLTSSGYIVVPLLPRL